MWLHVTCGKHLSHRHPCVHHRKRCIDHIHHDTISFPVSDGKWLDITLLHRVRAFCGLRDAVIIPFDYQTEQKRNRQMKEWWVDQSSWNHRMGAKTRSLLGALILFWCAGLQEEMNFGIAGWNMTHRPSWKMCHKDNLKRNSLHGWYWYSVPGMEVLLLEALKQHYKNLFSLSDHDLCKHSSFDSNVKHCKKKKNYPTISKRTWMQAEHIVTNI